MSLHLRFLGASETVTGSCFVLEAPGGRLMIDCGMFQGDQRWQGRNREFKGIEPESIDAVILTHAHADHVGRLPRLVKMGYDGPVFSTAPTRALARVVLLDSAGIHEEHARRARRRKRQGKRYDEEDLQTLFKTEDALQAIDMFQKNIGYLETIEVLPGIRATFRDAGHILGSAFVELEIDRSGQPPLRLTFSGDQGNLDKPIIRDPQTPNRADVVLLESTYGDRDHRPFSETIEELEGLVKETVERRGTLLMPSFALERSQELLYVLHGFWKKGILDGVPVFLDSPMAINATRIFARYNDYHDADFKALSAAGENPFQWGRLQYTRSADESRAINDITGPAIIIASSGMCTGGRIVHHLRNRLHRPDTTLAFLGYQARGTLGRKLVQGATEVTLYGREIEIQARIETLNGFSAHGGQSQLLDWFEHTGAGLAFLTHGEDRQVKALGEAIQERFTAQTVDPSYGDRVRI